MLSIYIKKKKISRWHLHSLSDWEEKPQSELLGRKKLRVLDIRNSRLE